MKQWLTGIPVSKKLGFIMVLASAVVIFETLIFLLATNSLNKEFESFDQRSFEGVKAVLETEKELNYFSRITREIMLGGDLNENLNKLDDTYEKIEILFKRMEQTTSDAAQRGICKKAKNDAMVFITSSRDLMRTLQNGPHDLGATYRFYHANFSPLAKASRESMKSLVASKMDEAARMKETFKNDILMWGIVAGIGGAIGIAAMIVIMLMIASQIKESLSLAQNGLLGFFRFLGGEEKHAQPLPDLGSDEFGKMGAMINRNIKEAEAKFNEQQQAILDFETICSNASKGFLHHRIATRYSDPNLQQLSRTLNTFLDEIELTFGKLVAIFVDFAQGDYSKSGESRDAKGSFASIDQAVSAVAASNSEIFSLISRFSREFTRDAHHLASSGDELSASANQQASSLEETAAAIEELTSNVASNTSKAETMARTAQEAMHAAERGNTVAGESLEAMHEIVRATEAINQAVDIIDNIAFQTNILSLNAAVEAATAGEAGKGFAVVAQEVRNLANRSADAAAQIQQLARSAREKSQGGLETSQNMMESFSMIARKITETDAMVRDVASASREQMAGINQINDAVSQLDQMTQQNAKTANNVAQIANEILDKTEQFEHMLSRIRFDESVEHRNCDVQMIFDTAKLKIDHINFKENNYKKLKSEHSVWRVSNHHECNLGKWIDEHASAPFAQGEAWNALLSAHEKVHSGVQSYIEADLSRASSQTLERITRDLEEATRGVFNGLDAIKSLNCGGNL
ncbi:MAG: methyl-accepting chemotaxis protein [Sulfuricurvum sp.]